MDEFPDRVWLSRYGDGKLGEKVGKSAAQPPDDDTLYHREQPCAERWARVRFQVEVQTSVTAGGSERYIAGWRAAMRTVLDILDAEKP